MTFDTQSWNLRAWHVDPLDEPLTEQTHDMLVDPQFELGGDAEFRLWGFPCEFGGDPAQLKGPHDMCVFDVTDDETIREAECPLSAEELADPSPLMHGGQRLLATTRLGEVVVWDLEGSSGVEELTAWSGSVPYITDWPDGSLRIWYQDSPNGPMAVFMRQSDDGGQTWSDPVEPISPNFECTAPVAGLFQGQYLFFCARMEM